MEFDATAYATGICNTAEGSSIETLVDTIDSTLAMLDRSAEFWNGMISGLPEHSREEETYKIEVEHVQFVQERWRELRKEIVQIEEDNEEGTTFSVTREEMQEQIEALNQGEVWEHPETGKQVELGDGIGSKDKCWTVWDDGDRYNFYSLDDVLNEVSE